MKEALVAESVSTGETCAACGDEVVLVLAGSEVLLECGCGSTAALA